MKRIILCAIVAAFAVAAQAGDGASCQGKEQGSCCASKVKTSLDAQANQGQDQGESSCCASKVKTSVETKQGCPMAAGACCKQGQAKQTAARRNVLLSPKAASYASN